MFNRMFASTSQEGSQSDPPKQTAATTTPPTVAESTVNTAQDAINKTILEQQAKNSQERANRRSLPLPLTASAARQHGIPFQQETSGQSTVPVLKVWKSPNPAEKSRPRKSGSANSLRRLVITTDPLVTHLTPADDSVETKSRVVPVTGKPSVKMTSQVTYVGLNRPKRPKRHPPVVQVVEPSSNPAPSPSSIALQATPPPTPSSSPKTLTSSVGTSTGTKSEYSSPAVKISAPTAHKKGSSLSAHLASRKRSTSSPAVAAKRSAELKAKRRSFNSFSDPNWVATPGQSLYQRPLAIQRAQRSPNVRKEPSELLPLRAGREEAKHVTIIPADEAWVVDLEMSKYLRHRKYFLCLGLITVCVGIAIAFLTVYSSLALNFLALSDLKSIFIIHTDLMIITCTLFFGFGVLVFRIFPKAKKTTVVIIHTVIFVSIFFIFGLALAIAFCMHKEVTGRSEHLYTLHSIVGVGIIFLLLWEAGSGIYVTFTPTSVPMCRYHASLGIVTFMLCAACCLSGYSVRALSFTGPLANIPTAKQIISDVTAVLILIFCCLLRYLATEFRFRRRPCPEWDIVYGRTVHAEEDQHLDNDAMTLQQYVRSNIQIMQEYYY